MQRKFLTLNEVYMLLPYSQLMFSALAPLRTALDNQVPSDTGRSMKNLPVQALRFLRIQQLL